MTAKAHLECVAGPEKGETFRVTAGITVLGRDPSCDIVLAETVISRQHTRIERRGENWVLVNLSTNGTLVNKKRVDEAILADGDDIRLGVKTRLTFIVESAAPVTSGRPQFRRRAAETAEAEAEEAEEKAKAEEAPRPSLFRRRRGLFIALCVYLGLILAAVMTYTVYKIIVYMNSEAEDTGVVVLQRYDQIRPAGSSRKWPITQEDAAGVYYQPVPDKLVLVPAADIASGAAVRIPGIQMSLDVKYVVRKPRDPNDKAWAGYPDGKPYNYPYVVEDQGSDVANKAKAESVVKQAITYYIESEGAGKDALLFQSVRSFQKALAYYGQGFLPKNADETVRLAALDKLVGSVSQTYAGAVSNQKAGHFVRAMNGYRRIIALVPDSNNAIYKNVNDRIGAIWNDYEQEARDTKK
jgi:hypothetical protein